MNVERIDQKFEPAQLKERKGSYGRTLTYASTDAYIRRMNEVFDYQWSTEVTDLRTESAEIIARVKVTANGIVKEQAGGKRIACNKEGEIISLADDSKAAISYAFKKCCQFFGIGLYLSEEDEDDRPNREGASESHGNGRPARVTQKVNGGITDEQLSQIKELRTNIGWSSDDVVGLCVSLYKTEEVTGLNKAQGNGLIAALRKQTKPQASPTPQGSRF